MKLLSSLCRIVLLVFFVYGCSDDPSPVGASLLPPSDQPVMKIDTVYASSHSVSRTLLNTSGSLRIMVGKCQFPNNQSYESWGMVKFSLPDSLVNVTITDAKISLRAGYHLGDTLAPLSFVVYRGLKSWLGDSLTLDSLKMGGYYGAIVSTPPPSVVGDTDIVEFSIDTAMVREWFANIPDTSGINNGVILQPMNSSIIKGFKSFINLNPEDHRPKLTIQYMRDGTPGTATIAQGSYRYAANIDYASLVQNSEHVYVQAGVAYNGYVNFISTSPVPSKASIHKAELELVLDSSLSRFNKYSIDSIVVYYVGPNGLDFFVPAAVSDTAIISGNKVYRFQIQQYMQRWVRGAAAGVALFTYSESDVFDLFTFYDENASQELKPKVIVTYSPTR